MSTLNDQVSKLVDLGETPDGIRKAMQDAFGVPSTELADYMDNDVRDIPGILAGKKARAPTPVLPQNIPAPVAAKPAVAPVARPPVAPAPRALAPTPTSPEEDADVAGSAERQDLTQKPTAPKLAGGLLMHPNEEVLQHIPAMLKGAYHVLANDQHTPQEQAEHDKLPMAEKMRRWARGEGIYRSKAIDEAQHATEQDVQERLKPEKSTILNTLSDLGDVLMVFPHLAGTVLLPKHVDDKHSLEQVGQQTGKELTAGMIGGTEAIMAHPWDSAKARPVTTATTFAPVLGAAGELLHTIPSVRASSAGLSSGARGLAGDLWARVPDAIKDKLPPDRVAGVVQFLVDGYHQRDPRATAIVESILRDPERTASVMEAQASRASARVQRKEVPTDIAQNTSDLLAQQEKTQQAVEDAQYDYDAAVAAAKASRDLRVNPGRGRRPAPDLSQMSPTELTEQQRAENLQAMSEGRLMPHAVEPLDRSPEPTAAAETGRRIRLMRERLEAAKQARASVLTAQSAAEEARLPNASGASVRIRSHLAYDAGAGLHDLAHVMLPTDQQELAARHLSAAQVLEQYPAFAEDIGAVARLYSGEEVLPKMPREALPGTPEHPEVSPEVTARAALALASTLDRESVTMLHLDKFRTAVAKLVVGKLSREAPPIDASLLVREVERRLREAANSGVTNLNDIPSFTMHGMDTPIDLVRQIRRVTDRISAKNHADILKLSAKALADQGKRQGIRSGLEEEAFRYQREAGDTSQAALVRDATEAHAADARARANMQESAIRERATAHRVALQKAADDLQHEYAVARTRGFDDPHRSAHFDRVSSEVHQQLAEELQRSRTEEVQRLANNTTQLQETLQEGPHPEDVATEEGQQAVRRLIAQRDASNAAADEVARQHPGSVVHAPAEAPSEELVDYAARASAAVAKGAMKPQVLPEGWDPEMVSKAYAEHGRRALLQSEKMRDPDTWMDTSDMQATQAKEVAREAAVAAQLATEVKGFRELPSDIGVPFKGAVSPGFHSTITYDRLARQGVQDAFIRKLTAGMKMNLTAGNPASAINNFAANMTLAVIRRGVDPFSYTARAAYQYWQYGRFRDGLSYNAKYERAFKAIEQTGLLDTDAVKQDIGMGRGIDFGMLPFKLANEKMTALYRFGDNFFKLEEAVHNFDTLDRYTKALRPGQEMEVQVTPRASITITKTADGYQLRNTTGQGQATAPAMDVQAGPILDSVLAKAGGKKALDLMFDYSDTSNFVKWLKQAPVVGMASPFFTWTWKATDVPGFKKGLGYEMMAQPLSVKTTSPQVAMMQLGEAAKVATARSALLGAVRTDVLDHKNHELADMIARAPAEQRLYWAQALSDPRYIGYWSYANWNPIKPTEALFRIAAGAYEQLSSPSLKGLPLEQQRKVLRTNELMRAADQGELVNGKHVLELIGAAGSPIMDALTYAKDSEQQGKHVTAQALMQKFASSLMGGLYSKALDVGVGSVAPNSIFTTRGSSLTLDPVTSEPFLRWAIRKFTGMGWQVKDIALKVDPRSPGSFLNQAQAEWLDSLGVKRDLKNGVRDYITAKQANDPAALKDAKDRIASAKRLSALVKGEIKVMYRDYYQTAKAMSVKGLPSPDEAFPDEPEQPED